MLLHRRCGHMRIAVLLGNGKQRSPVRKYECQYVECVCGDRMAAFEPRALPSSLLGRFHI